MIIIMKPKATGEEISSLCTPLQTQSMQIQRSAGVGCVVLGVIGDVAHLEPHV